MIKVFRRISLISFIVFAISFALWIYCAVDDVFYEIEIKMDSLLPPENYHPRSKPVPRGLEVFLSSIGISNGVLTVICLASFAVFIVSFTIYSVLYIAEEEKQQENAPENIDK